MFRNEKPGPGRFRQFMQFDADTVGSASPAADAEMCMMAADTMEALGIPRGSYVVKVNNRKVLDGVLEAIGLGGEENAGKRLTVLRAIDKLDRLGSDGRACYCSARGRKDESGDFTKGAGLDRRADRARCCNIDTRAIGGYQRRTSINAVSWPGIAHSLPSDAKRARMGLERNRRNSLSGSAGYDDTNGFGSIHPSSAASNTTPARSTRLS